MDYYEYEMMTHAELIRDLQLHEARAERRRSVIVDVLTLLGYVTAIGALAALSVWGKR